MKRAVSVSIGSSKRDKAVETELLGQAVRIERIGTDGDMEKAAQLYRERDGTGGGVGARSVHRGAHRRTRPTQTSADYQRSRPLGDDALVPRRRLRVRFRRLDVCLGAAHSNP